MRQAEGSCIADLDDAPIFPIIGKLKLGVAAEGPGTEPTELEYFRISTHLTNVQKKFHALYGDRPTRLRIVLVSEDIDKVFASRYQWFTDKVCLCRGNGETARRAWTAVEPELQATLARPEQDHAEVEIPCPCPRKGTACILRGRFSVMLPEVHPAGCFEVYSGSVVNLKSIRGTLKAYKGTFGRISEIPYLLLRHPVRTQRDGAVELHYRLQLIFEGDYADVNRIRQQSGLEPHPVSQALDLLQAAARPVGDENPAGRTGRAAPSPPPTLAAPEGAGAATGTERCPTPDARPNAGAIRAGRPRPGSGHLPPEPGAAPATDPQPRAARDPNPSPAPAGGAAQCTGCGGAVTPRVAQYSQAHFGVIRCMSCQKRNKSV